MEMLRRKIEEVTMYKPAKKATKPALPKRGARAATNKKIKKK
tara:strand:- start:177 stop:302 length:126 start_codon:yes stop_codon:yes gene_type:complete